MIQSNDGRAQIPTVTGDTPTPDDELVYYCSWNGRVKRVKPRELPQVEHGGIRRRYCKECEQITPHAVMTRAEVEDHAHVVEALVRVLNHLGVVVRRSPRDNGFYGVQMVHHDGTDDKGRIGTEVLFCGPISHAALVWCLHEATEVATQVADGDLSGLTNYVHGPLGRSIQAVDRESRMSGGGCVRLGLSYCYGLPAEVGEVPYPPFRLFAEKLRDILDTTERDALVLVLTGKAADADMQQAAALGRPAGINVDTWHYDDPDKAVKIYRSEIPRVLW